MRRVSMLCCVLTAWFAVQHVAHAVTLEVALNVCVEVLPRGDMLKPSAKFARERAEANPDDPTLARTAINYELAIQNGFQYSYPADLFVDLTGDGSVSRYRIDFLQPTINIFDPSFTPQNPTIEYKDRVTIIRNGKKKYVLSQNMESGSQSESVILEEQDSAPSPFETVEIWYPVFNFYMDLLSGVRNPYLTTAAFERYEVDGTLIELSTDKLSARFVSGSIGAPDSYGVLKLTSYGRHPFPLTFESWWKNVRSVRMYFTVTRELNGEEAKRLFEIPEVNQKHTETGN